MSLTESHVELSAVDSFGELVCALGDLALPSVLSASRGLLQKLWSRKIGDASFGQEVSG